MNVKLPGEWLVIGSGSLTGSRFVELTGQDSSLYGAGGDLDISVGGLKDALKLDITNQDEVLSVIDQTPAKYIINFAGATLVDEIEKTRPQDSDDQQELNKNLAYRVNVLGTQSIVEACQKFSKFPIFISTDFVFDGQNGPYAEEDQLASSPTDVSWYAWTKILAEQVVSSSGIAHLTLRISYPYRREYPPKSDFARNFLEKEIIYPVFADQTLTPTFIDDIPQALAVLTENNSTGIFHLASPESTSPYDFCLELLRVAKGVENPATVITKGSILEFQKNHPDLAKRPIHGGLKSDKIIKLGFTPTNWREGIQKAYG